MKYKVNIFMAWYFIPLAIAMGFVAAIGRVVLELLGVSTYEGDIPGRLIGALLLFAAVYTVLHVRGSLPPQGNMQGNGFRFGHAMVLAGNILTAMFVTFQFTFPLIENRDVHHLLNGFTDAFGYWAMACWMVGFSFIYQSAMPKNQ